VEESYSIPGFWEQSDTNSPVLKCELRPTLLEHYLHIPDGGGRKAPYAIGDPISIHMETAIELPEQWSATLTPREYSTEAFSYKYSGTHAGNRINILHEYQRHKEQVAAAEFAEFITTERKISNQLSLILTWNPAAKQFSLSGLSVLLLIFMTVLGLYGARRVYAEFDPPARREEGEGRKLGGWLSVLGIGVIISPITLAYQIATTGAFFNKNLLMVSDRWVVPLVVEAELALNLALLVMGILTAVLLFMRRTSFPKIFTIYLSSFLAVQVIDLLTVALLFDGETGIAPASIGNVARVAAYAAIWIPYVWISERSKETFLVRLDRWQHVEWARGWHA
jgi:hypothetical protein